MKRRSWASLIVPGLVCLTVASSALSQETGGTVVQTGTGSAHTVAPLDRTIALHLVRATLQQALDTVEARSGLRLVYSTEQLPADKIVSIDANQITVAAALRFLLTDTDLTVLTDTNGHVGLGPRRLAEGSSVLVQQGTAVISGYVRDSATGAAIPQVTVRIDGTALETKSDVRGQYKIVGITAGEYRVTARRVGYLATTRTVTLGDGQSKAVDFGLMPPATKLDEVVTTAVGDQRRYAVGNVISTINVDSIAPTAPVTSITDLISARAPGVEVMENNGLVGSGESIRIRGVSSLVLQSDPIVIVDGVRVDNAPGGYTPRESGESIHSTPSRINDLNFDDVETINILKGPAASTEYGTDAANGVIVITTKHGAAGSPLWHADAEQAKSGLPQAFPAKYYSWGHLTDGTGTRSDEGTGTGTAIGGCSLVPPNGGYYIDQGPSLGVGATSGNCVVDSVTQFNPLNDPATTMFGTGERQKYDLSVGGGSDAVRYYFAGGMSNETGIMRVPPIFKQMADTAGLTLPAAAFKSNIEQQRSVRLNTQMKLGANADLSVNANYLSTFAQTPDEEFLLTGPLNSASVDNAGDMYGYSQFGGTALGNRGTSFSPFQELSQIGSDNTTGIAGGATANWRPTSWFVGHATAGIDHGSDQQLETDYPIGNNSAFNTFGTNLAITNGSSSIYTLDLRAAVTAEPIHRLQTITSVGLQLADTRGDNESGLVYGLSLSNLSLDGYPGPQVNETTNASATLGGYAEEQLGIADRLFLIGAIRVDGASGFGSSYAVAAYPKASVSWLVVADTRTMIRLRGALGESGVQPPNGASLLIYSTGGLVSSATGTLPADYISWPGNPNLRPERSEEYEGGIDIGGWGNRVSVEVTAYRKMTHDALVNESLSGDLCCYTYEENVGSVQNDGLEMTTTVGLLDSRLIQWEVTVNASTNHNKLVTLAPEGTVVTGGFSNNNAFVAGYPLYGIWGYPMKYADANHDGIIEPNEVSLGDSLRYVGPGAPTQEASLSTHVGLWRGLLTLGGLLDYRGGYRINNHATAYLSRVGATPETNFPTAPLWLQARSAIHDPPNVAYLEDGTLLRFRELSLTYAVPRGVARRLRLVDNLSLTAAVHNLALWTRYTGADPEVSNEAYNGSNIIYNQTPGANGSPYVNNDIRADNGTVPLLRDWVVRLNVGLK